MNLYEINDRHYIWGNDQKDVIQTSIALNLIEEGSTCKVYAVNDNDKIVICQYEDGIIVISNGKYMSHDGLVSARIMTAKEYKEFAGL